MAIFPRFWALEIAILANFKAQIGDFWKFRSGNTDKNKQKWKSQTEMSNLQANSTLKAVKCVQSPYTYWEKVQHFEHFVWNRSNQLLFLRLSRNAQFERFGKNGKNELEFVSFLWSHSKTVSKLRNFTLSEKYFVKSTLQWIFSENVAFTKFLSKKCSLNSVEITKIYFHTFLAKISWK